jgi:hypothetical protein
MQVLDCVQPLPDELVLPKTSSSVFGSTAIAYLLRNMGIDQLVIPACCLLLSCLLSFLLLLFLLAVIRIYYHCARLQPHATSRSSGQVQRGREQAPVVQPVSGTIVLQRRLPPASMQLRSRMQPAAVSSRCDRC